MTKKDTNSLRMYQKVQDLLANFIAIWGGLAAMVATNTAFDALVEKIKKDLDIQGEGITGYTKEKKKKKFSMATAGYALCKKVRSYAYAIDDQELLGKLMISFSDMYYKASSKSVAYANNVLKEVQAMTAADKTKYGISDAEETEFKDMITAFEAYTTAPRGGIIERMVATKNIRDNCKLTNLLLKERMDNDMVNFEFSHPDFYNQYKESRKVVDLHRQTVIEGNVTDEAGIDLKKVKVTIVGKDKTTNEEKVVFEEMTDKDGNFAKRVINPEFEYKVTFELATYVPQTFEDVDLHAGEHELFDVKLVKIPTA